MDVRALATHHIGPLPAWAWTGIAAAVAGLFHFSKAPAAAPVPAARSPIVYLDGQPYGAGAGGGDLAPLPPDQQPPSPIGPAPIVYDPMTGTLTPAGTTTTDTTPPTPSGSGAPTAPPAPAAGGTVPPPYYPPSSPAAVAAAGDLPTPRSWGYPTGSVYDPQTGIVYSPSTAAEGGVRQRIGKVQHPGMSQALIPGVQGVQPLYWGGHTFTTQAEFAAWARAHGSSVNAELGKHASAREIYQQLPPGGGSAPSTRAGRRRPPAGPSRKPPSSAPAHKSSPPAAAPAYRSTRPRQQVAAHAEPAHASAAPASPAHAEPAHASAAPGTVQTPRYPPPPPPKASTAPKSMNGTRSRPAPEKKLPRPVPSAAVHPAKPV